MTKLLPCPFCNDDDPEMCHYRIECSNCGAQAGESDNPQTKIEYWNTRACDKQSTDYLQGFNDAKKQMFAAIDKIMGTTK